MENKRKNALEFYPTGVEYRVEEHIAPLLIFSFSIERPTQYSVGWSMYIPIVEWTMRGHVYSRDSIMKKAQKYNTYVIFPCRGVRAASELRGAPPPFDPARRPFLA